MKVIFLHRAGPLIEYREGCLHIADLNPERYLQWRVSRWKIALTMLNMYGENDG